jgi:hypothetical protein
LGERGASAPGNAGHPRIPAANLRLGEMGKRSRFERGIGDIASRLDAEPDDLGPFAAGVRSWSKTIALASPDVRPAIFRNCITEGATFVRKGAPRGLITSELIERAERHELLDPLGGREAVEKIVAEGLADADAPRKTANGQDKTGDAPPADDGGLLGWDAGDDDQVPPPRGWLLGTSFCRGFASSLLGDGGVGKTALRYAQGLSLATKRALTREHVFQRCRVLIVSLEDGRDELRRRLRAACLHHGIERSELKGWLFIEALRRADGKLMTLDQHNRPVLPGVGCLGREAGAHHCRAQDRHRHARSVHQVARDRRE